MKLLLRLDRRIVLGASVAVLAVTGLLMLHPVTRGWLREKLAQVLAVGPDRLQATFTFIADALEHLTEQEGQVKLANHYILDQQLEHPAPHVVLEYLPIILARSHMPLTTSEIVQQMRRTGYEPRGMHPERYVAKLLREHPSLFEQQRPRRWGLRSHWSTEIATLQGAG